MALTKRDSLFIRQAQRASQRAAELRAVDATADAVFAELDLQTEALLAASRAVVREMLDDPGLRAARDAAVHALRSALRARLARFASELVLHTTDEHGNLSDPDTAAYGQALLDRWTPRGGTSNLPDTPDALVLATQNVIASMASIPWAAAAAAQLEPLVTAVEHASAAVRSEAAALALAYSERDAARARANRVAAAARAYCSFVEAWRPELGVTLRDVFPAAERPRARSKAVALDEADAPAIEDESHAD